MKLLYTTNNNNKDSTAVPGSEEECSAYLGQFRLLKNLALINDNLIQCENYKPIIIILYFKNNQFKLHNKSDKVLHKIKFLGKET